MQSLSSYLQHQADNRHDRRIPDETRRFIAQVAAAERAMGRDAGPIDTARRSLVAAYEEFSDAYAALRQMERMAADRPTDGMLREEVARLRASTLASLDWLADCRERLSVEIRKAVADRREGAAA